MIQFFIMKLTPDVFKIDCASVVDKIKTFIAGQCQELKRDGVVVPISGGLDSTTVITLCVLALGKDRVTGLLLPEKKGNPDAKKFAKISAKQLGIATRTINISGILQKLGAYRFIGNMIPSRKLLAYLVRKYKDRYTTNLFANGLQSSKNKLVRSALVETYMKQRIRCVVTCRYAEQNNLMFVGSAHKSEDLIGLFVKFGVDDNADLMPLKQLYRSHILQIAQFIGVPGSIIGRTPNPDMLPGIEDKYYDSLNIKAGTVDLVLYGIEHGIPPADISAQAGVPEQKVAEIAAIMEITRHMREPSRSIAF